MPRLLAVLLAALAGTAHAPWGGMDQNLLDCEYDLPQHACPTCEGAPLGLAGGMPDAVAALTPRCIEAEGGCCEHDGFEYFLKASLARYQSGNVVSFFYPGKADMVSWVARDDAMAGGREDRGGARVAADLAGPRRGAVEGAGGGDGDPAGRLRQCQGLALRSLARQPRHGHPAVPGHDGLGGGLLAGRGLQAGRDERVPAEAGRQVRQVRPARRGELLAPGRQEDGGVESQAHELSCA